MNYEILDIDYSFYNGTTWSKPINISHLEGQSCEPRIAIDSKDHPHIVWEERAGGYYRPYYTCYNGISWFPPDTIVGKQGFRPLIVINPKDHIHLLWTGRTKIGEPGIWYTFRTGAHWSKPVDIDHSSKGCSAVDGLVIDKRDCLHTVWGRNDGIFYSRNPLSGIDESGSENISPNRKGEVYPNPSIGKTMIICQILKASDIVLTVYDSTGSRVKEVNLGYKEAGRYKVDLGALTPGIYFCLIKAGNSILTYKMVRME